MLRLYNLSSKFVKEFESYRSYMSHHSIDVIIDYFLGGTAIRLAAITDNDN
ncbi:hypothetical protein [Coleofasciculus sp.]|uniref:hypothetical protein n=1 Tax=Coleofasciculus sp. TaxID=3100458 RepID=UPI003A126992